MSKKYKKCTCDYPDWTIVQYKWFWHNMWNKWENQQVKKECKTSKIKCKHCNAEWRTDAKYVDRLLINNKFSDFTINKSIFSKGKKE